MIKALSSNRNGLCVFLPTVAACIIASDFASAQEDRGDDEFEEPELEEVIVTGSRIKRRDFESPSPLATIDRDALEATGRATLEETLNLLPQVQPDLSRTVNNGGDGTARVNLRGIGAGRTLVLMNGRRVAPSGTGSAVDLNNLPQSLIERVEIITGGASTVYGSDAIAGVVNFITREDFRGLALDADYSVTGEGDAQIYSADLSYGHHFANGRGNVTFYAGYYDREDLLAGSRTLTRVPIDNDPATGTAVEVGTLPGPSALIFAPPVDFGSGPNWTTFTPDGTPRAYVDPDDQYNFAPINYLQTPLQRKSAGVLAHFELSPDYELYLESNYASNHTAQQLAEVPAVTFAAVNVDNPVLLPETRQFFEEHYLAEPGLVFIGVGRRLSEVGPRIIEQERDYWRTVVGVRGFLGSGWEIDGWVTYTRAEEAELYINDASASRFQQGLLVDPATGECFDPSAGCVPVDIFGEGRISDEAAEFLRVTNVQNDTERAQQLASVVVTGSPIDTWAGPLETAFGLEWRSDEASFRADEILFSGDTLGFRGAAPVEGTEKVTEIYTEAVVPLAENASWANYFALEFGVRYSDYDLAGGIWTYKFGANWQLTPGFRLRGMQQRSVRAPNNAELFTELFAETSLFVADDPSVDPCSASNDPVALGYTEKCVIQGMPADQVGEFEAFTVPTDFIYGGNPDLEPENADTLTLGIVLQPLRFEKWQLSIDYFEIEVTDSIGDIAPVDICFDTSNTENLFCDYITRDAAAGYNVVEVFSPQSNRGRITSRGIDTQINYRTELPGAFSWFGDAAEFEFDLYWTHTLENSWQLSPVTGVIECAGLFGEFCPINRIGQGATIPENRVVGQLGYVTDKVGIYLYPRWLEGTTNSEIAQAAIFGQPEPLLAVPSVGSRLYVDLGISYRFTDDLYARVGINNLTDSEPPLMPDQANNTDTLLYDIFGRSYFLSISATFGR